MPHQQARQTEPSVNTALEEGKDVLLFQAFPGRAGIIFQFLGNIDAALFKRLRCLLAFQPGDLERFKPAVELVKGVLLVGFELHEL